MSTLEQIRQRPILIISVLGVALLLFILTAVDNPRELFSDSHTVAKVDGEKIDYMDFQRRVEQQQEQLQQRGYNGMDAAQVQEYVLRQMISETLMQKEYDRLGLTVTDNELSHAMVGATPHPYVNQMAQSMGLPNAQTLYDIAYNSAKSGVDPQQAAQYQAYWTSMEKDVEQMLLQQKFMNMFMGVLTANKLDAKAVYEDNASTATIAYAKKDLSTLKNEDFPVSGSEAAELYKQEKNRYHINEAQHMINYIAVDIVPSQEDLAAAEKEVEDAMAGLRLNEGTEAVANNSKFYVNRNSAPEYGLTTALKKVVPTMAQDSVTMVSFIDNKYTLAKLLGKSTAVDSVMLDFALVAENAVVDSIVGKLNSGAKIADLGESIAQSQDSVWVSLLDPNMSVMKEEIEKAENGKYFASSNNAQNKMIVKVVTRKAPVVVYDLAEVTYEVVPSKTTEQNLRDALNTYITTNNTSETFKSEATKAGYSALSAVVTPSTLSVNGLPDSRGAAKWTLGASKGDVSPIFTDDRNSRLMAVAVDDVYNGDFMPASNEMVSTYLFNKLRNQKKAEKLMADYAGKGNSVEEYATVMDVKVDTTQVTFGQSFVRNFPMYESALQANVAVAKVGDFVGPIALNGSVVVFKVTDVNNQGREFDYENDALVFNQREGATSFQRSLADVILGGKKIENRIQNFYSDRQ